MMNLIYTMCSRHGMNTIMLTLALSKKIILIPSNSFSLLKMSCATLTKSSNYWRQSVFSRSRTTSDKNHQIVEGSQYLVEVEQPLTKIFKSSNCWRRSVFGRHRTTSDKNLQIVEGSQYLVEVEQPLTKICKSSNCWRRTVFGRSRTISDKNLQIVERCQYLVEVEQPLTKIFKLLKEVSIW
jgi:hypothetical protein